MDTRDSSSRRSRRAAASRTHGHLPGGRPESRTRIRRRPRISTPSSRRRPASHGGGSTPSGRTIRSSRPRGRCRPRCRLTRGRSPPRRRTLAPVGTHPRRRPRGEEAVLTRPVSPGRPAPADLPVSPGRLPRCLHRPRRRPSPRSHRGGTPVPAEPGGRGDRRSPQARTTCRRRTRGGRPGTRRRPHRSSRHPATCSHRSSPTPNRMSAFRQTRTRRLPPASGIPGHSGPSAPSRT